MAVERNLLEVLEELKALVGTAEDTAEDVTLIGLLTRIAEALEAP
jgi:hypothetical protein